MQKIRKSSDSKEPINIFKKTTAFTLAEVLITLVIIGVVAAITIPTVLKNYNDRKYNTARLKAMHTFGETGKMASINGEINGYTNAKDFVNNVLSKYLKIMRVCDTAQECNFPAQIKPLNPSANKLVSDNLKTWNSIGSYNKTGNNLTAVSDANLSTYVSIQDGFSAKIFYNPNCVRNSHDNPYYASCSNKECITYFVDDTCINVIYDMNGLRGPNQAGYDIGFVTTFWSGLNASYAAPGLLPYNVNFSAPSKNHSDAMSYCDNLSTSKTRYYLPSVDELTSAFINSKLSSIRLDVHWAATPTLGFNNYFWTVRQMGIRDHFPAQSNNSAYCVRR